MRHTFAPLCNNGAVVLFLTLYMLLADIVDYNVCKIHSVSFTNNLKVNIIFDTTPFRDIYKKRLYIYHS